MIRKSPHAYRNRLPLLLAGLILVCLAAFWLHRPRSQRTAPLAPSSESLFRSLLALEARELAATTDYWAPEMTARECGAVVERLWDAVHAASNRLGVLTTARFRQIVQPVFAAPESLPHGIRLFRPADLGPRGPTLALAAWTNWLGGIESEGWQLDQIELRHNRFDPDDAGETGESVFGFRAHLTRPATAARPEARAAVEGPLRVTWRTGEPAESGPSMDFVDASRLVLKLREGPPAFRPLPPQSLVPPPRSHFTDPLLIEDLDGDGRVEVALISANRVFSLDAAGGIRDREFLPGGPGLPFTAVLGDFDTDGRPDLLTAEFDGLRLRPGQDDGGFVPSARLCWQTPERIRYGQVLTCGDVDADGDLDVWFGQYKNPYDGGQMPTPFHDANDGYPSWLLLNDGAGSLRDATVAAGLGERRWRRTYAASFADLDADGDLDLLVVNDFAGVDLHLNDGRGRFRDVSGTWLADPKAFGMAHALADFNADGHLDLFVTGMHCPTASRLAHLGLGRPERPDYLAAIPRMIRGNKLLLNRDNLRFEDNAAAAGVDHTGWSWGSAAADFDNDGFPDLAIANGHETRQSVAEYEPEFWLHDLYAADSRENPVAAQYFAAKIRRLRGGGMSYGGWEQNRLFLNRGPAGFVEVGHLLGVALTEDSRNLGWGDLDGDGRLDLVVTTFESWPHPRQTLRLFRNELPRTGHWLAVTIPRTGADPSGASVTLHRPDGRTVAAAVVTGDSHRTQQPARVHFGLGTEPCVAAVVVRWPDGRVSRLEEPAPDRLHRVDVPPARR